MSYKADISSVKSAIETKDNTTMPTTLRQIIDLGIMTLIFPPPVLIKSFFLRLFCFLFMLFRFSKLCGKTLKLFCSKQRCFIIQYYV